MNQGTLVDVSRRARTVEVDPEFLRSLGYDPAEVGKGYKHRMSPAMRRACRAPSGITVPDWAEKYYFLVTDSGEPIPYRHDKAEYLRGIMHALGQPYVREVWTVSPPQCGKSTVAEVFAGYVADQDPGPTMYVLNDEVAAKSHMKERIVPAFKASRQLRRYLTGKIEDEKGGKLNLENMYILMAWPTPGKLSRVSIRYIILDELDKWPSMGKAEAPARMLAEVRTRTYPHDSKRYYASSCRDEGSEIWQGFLGAQVRFQFQVQCPSCGVMQPMHSKVPKEERMGDWDKWRLRIPEDVRDPAKVLAEKLAWYQCPHCSAQWDDLTRDKAVRGGAWFDPDTGLDMEAYLETHKPMSVGFQLSALYSPWVPLSETASWSLRAKNDPGALRHLMNGYLGLPWLVRSIKMHAEDDILLLRDERSTGEVPGGGVVSILTAGVDTQDNGFWYEIRAWGWGQALESWQIKTGFLGPSFEDMEQVVLGSEFYDPDGNAYRVTRGIIDSQGHRTKEVYEWTRRTGGRMRPCQGVWGANMTAPWSLTDITKQPGTNKPMRGVPQLLRLNTTYFKDGLSAKLAIAPHDPGAWHMCADLTRKQAKQLTVETPTGKGGIWVCGDHDANHLWDVSYIQLGLVDHLGVAWWVKPEESGGGVKRVKKQKSARSKRW